VKIEKGKKVIIKEEEIKNDKKYLNENERFDNERLREEEKRERNK
jgi:hypothetical protein